MECEKIASVMERRKEEGDENGELWKMLLYTRYNQKLSNTKEGATKENV